MIFLIWFLLLIASLNISVPSLEVLYEIEAVFKGCCMPKPPFFAAFIMRAKSLLSGIKPARERRNWFFGAFVKASKEISVVTTTLCIIPHQMLIYSCCHFQFQAHHQ